MNNKIYFKTLACDSVTANSLLELRFRKDPKFCLGQRYRVAKRINSKIVKARKTRMPKARVFRVSISKIR